MLISSLISKKRLISSLSLSTLLLFADLRVSLFDAQSLTRPHLTLLGAAASAQTVDERKAEADRLFQQGIQQFRVSQFREALQSWEQALQIYRAIGDRQGEANALDNLGSAYRNLGQYPQAIEFFQRSLEIAQKTNDHQATANALNHLGIAYLALGQHHQAVEFFEQSLSIAQELGDRQGEAYSLGNLGIAYHRLGQYQQSIEAFQQLLVFSQETGDRRSEGASLNNLGNSYSALGRNQQAIECFHQSLEIAQELSNRSLEADVLNNLGISYRRLGQYHQAIQSHKQSQTIYQEISDRHGEARSLNGLGNVYSSLGQPQRTVQFYRQALEIYHSIGDRAGEGIALSNLGSAHFELGEYPQALESYQQALIILKETSGCLDCQGRILASVGRIQLGQGEYAQAFDSFHQALEIFKQTNDRPGEGEALADIGDFYFVLEQYQQSIKFCEQALAITREIGDRAGEGSALSNLGLALLNLGEFVAATERLEAAVGVLDSLRDQELEDTEEITLFETQTRTYKLLQQALIAQNETERALAASEWGRARAFVSLLSSSLASPAEAQATDSAASTATNRISIAQIQQIAREQNATLVQYSVIFNESLYIWVVQPTGEIAFRQVPFAPEDAEQTELVNSVVFGNNGLMRGQPQDTVTPQLSAETRAVLEVGRYATIDVEYKGDIASTDRLRQLHQLLIEPIADLLPTNESDRVIFIPQGGLFLVPFPALIDAQDDYLIEHHTILTTPSIEVLGLTRKLRQETEQQVTGEVLVVGNPVMPQLPQVPGVEPITLLPLPGAEQEARDIADFFGTQALLGAQATETAVLQQMPQARIIHLATHGLLEYGNPQDSGVRDLPGAIALTPVDEQDGLLTSAEILQMDLQAELVVLSACDTGRGRVTGDGVIGLSRSFISAGVPSVMVSLWSVPDAPTAELMREFYRQWQQQPDKARALRQAMLTTMQTHPNPRDWAAFTLIGEAE